MAIWRVSNCTPRSIAEREIWTHPDKGEIVREILFTSGAYLVVTEDDNPPEFEREAVPGGDGAEDSVDMNFCGYETQLIGLEGGCKLLITWPDDLGSEERQQLTDAWDEGMHEAWEEEGWELDDTEVWFWDDLNIELLEATSHENDDWVNYDLDEEGEYPLESGEYDVIVGGSQQKAYFYGGGWWNSKYAEDDGDLEVEKWLRGSLTAEKSAKEWVDKLVAPANRGDYEVWVDAPWPLGGIERSTWTGSTWANEDGDEVKITKWRPLST